MNFTIYILMVSIPYMTTILAIPNTIIVSSTAFNNEEPIPVKYTCSGSGFSPQLSWNIVPNAKSYVLFVEDPDAPSGRYTHWIVYNIPGELVTVTEHLSFKADEVVQRTLNIPENTSGYAIGALEGISSNGKPGYIAPCPSMRTHRYYFTIYAIDKILDLPDHATKVSIEQAIQGHIIGQGSLMGTFKKE